MPFVKLSFPITKIEKKKKETPLGGEKYKMFFKIGNKMDSALSCLDLKESCFSDT